MRSNRKGLLEKLDPVVREDVLAMADVFKRSRFECYLVGGCVRDLIMGRQVKDLDFTTNAYPEDTQRLFKRTVPTGIKHGTVTVLCGSRENSRSYEVTTYRADGTYSDARRPDQIAYASILSEDLKRRDFTMNALAYDPLTEVLVDEHNGLEDIAHGIIRTIGRPFDRFHEDGLRTVRAARFAAVLGFFIDEETKSALRDAEIHARTSKVAVERFADELWKGMAGMRPSVMLSILDTTGIMRCFVNVPPASDTTLADIDRLTNPMNRLAVWLLEASRDFPGGMHGLARALKLSGKDSACAERIGLLLSYGGKEPPEHRRLCAYFKKTCDEPLEHMHDARELAMLRPALEPLFPQFEHMLKDEPLLPRDLALRGEDIRALGFDGPAIGGQIERLLEYVYQDPSRNTRETLTQFLKAGR